ncbi:MULTISPECIES: hypothetical protein [Bacillus]|uniref:hypothetical protein n=1 Tax=Bacillus TaxID=1386 RepID=UPI0009B4BAC7|nr:MULTISPECIES: hypothetical protein [Bacillus cereus group]MED2997366.1 hypothetical protein [Bacillus tropicus]OTY55744.1 hypothetical protein BK748_16435 [Bacillus thuringiensis serovar graciosensis]
MSLYEQLPDNLLAGFFMEINKNIQTGILSEAMYHEITLIQMAAQKRNLSESDLKEIYQTSVGSQYKTISSDGSGTNNKQRLEKTQIPSGIHS